MSDRSRPFRGVIQFLYVDDTLAYRVRTFWSALPEYDCRLCRDLDSLISPTLIFSPSSLLESSLISGRKMCCPVIGYGDASSLESAYYYGAVDYLKIPWTLDEMRLRAQGFLKRGLVYHQGWTLQQFRHRLTKEGISVDFSVKEFSLLIMLLNHYGEPVPRSCLSRTAGLSDSSDSRVLDQYILMLRKKLNSLSAGDEDFRIICRKGLGYLIF